MTAITGTCGDCGDVYVAIVTRTVRVAVCERCGHVNDSAYHLPAVEEV